MKYLDKVRVIVDDYASVGIHKGDNGHILSAAIRQGTFDFYRLNPLTLADDISCAIAIEHLELVEGGNATDDMILHALPSRDINWWCKVEEGYIINIKGDKKNKIPYDYNS